MIKTLAGCIREYKFPSILAPIYVTLEVIMEVLLPFLMATLIDDGVNKGDMEYIIKTGLMLAAVRAAQNLLAFILAFQGVVMPQGSQALGFGLAADQAAPSEKADGGPGAAGSGSPGGPGGEPAEDLLPLRRRRRRDGVRILRHAF